MAKRTPESAGPRGQPSVGADSRSPRASGCIDTSVIPPRTRGGDVHIPKDPNLSVVKRASSLLSFLAGQEAQEKQDKGGTSKGGNSTPSLKGSQLPGPTDYLSRPVVPKLGLSNSSPNRNRPGPTFPDDMQNTKSNDDSKGHRDSTKADNAHSILKKLVSKKSEQPMAYTTPEPLAEPEAEAAPSGFIARSPRPHARTIGELTERKPRYIPPQPEKPPNPTMNKEKRFESQKVVEIPKDRVKPAATQQVHTAREVTRRDFDAQLSKALIGDRRPPQRQPSEKPVERQKTAKTNREATRQLSQREREPSREPKPAQEQQQPQPRQQQREEARPKRTPHARTHGAEFEAKKAREAEAPVRQAEAPSAAQPAAATPAASSAGAKDGAASANAPEEQKPVAPKRQSIKRGQTAVTASAAAAADVVQELPRSQTVRRGLTMAEADATQQAEAPEAPQAERALQHSSTKQTKRGEPDGGEMTKALSQTKASIARAAIQAQEDAIQNTAAEQEPEKLKRAATIKKKATTRAAIDTAEEAPEEPKKRASTIQKKATTQAVLEGALEEEGPKGATALQRAATARGAADEDFDTGLSMGRMASTMSDGGRGMTRQLSYLSQTEKGMTRQMSERGMTRQLSEVETTRRGSADSERRGQRRSKDDVGEGGPRGSLDEGVDADAASVASWDSYESWGEVPMRTAFTDRALRLREGMGLAGVFEPNPSVMRSQFSQGMHSNCACPICRPFDMNPAGTASAGASANQLHYINQPPLDLSLGWTGALHKKRPDSSTYNSRSVGTLLDTVRTTQEPQPHPDIADQLRFTETLGRKIRPGRAASMDSHSLAGQFRKNGFLVEHADPNGRIEERRIRGATTPRSRRSDVAMAVSPLSSDPPAPTQITSRSKGRSGQGSEDLISHESEKVSTHWNQEVYRFELKAVNTTSRSQSLPPPRTYNPISWAGEPEANYLSGSRKAMVAASRTPTSGVLNFAKVANEHAAQRTARMGNDKHFADLCAITADRVEKAARDHARSAAKNGGSRGVAGSLMWAD